jgi:uroporphyrinogen decarboxylase
MTSRERLLIAMKNGQPDCVPVAPDTSNMIPCRLTGKPFWDIYLWQDPPLWQAYIHCAKHFGFDGWLPSVPVTLDYEAADAAARPAWQQAIVARTPEFIITRTHAEINGRLQWSKTCNVYYPDNPPTGGVALAKVGLTGADPDQWEDVVPRTSFPGTSALTKARELMGEAGIVGGGVWLPGLGLAPESMYEYYDNHQAVVERCEKARQTIVRRTEALVKLEMDFLLVGVSGFMLSNPPPIFRELALATLKDITAVCRKAGMPSQIHCCGPEYDLVKISAEETDLDNINPLEVPPMGDCDLGRLKREFGAKLSLMGNLHTTDVMLRGTPQDVVRASRQAIDDAGAGGGFILSTGDQCGRDTPDANLEAMIETARTYGRY